MRAPLKIQDTDTDQALSGGDGVNDRWAKEISLTLYLTTIHEAGHALMAAYQGVSFTSVRVRVQDLVLPAVVKAMP